MQEARYTQYALKIIRSCNHLINYCVYFVRAPITEPMIVTILRHRCAVASIYYYFKIKWPVFEAHVSPVVPVALRGRLFFSFPARSLGMEHSSA